MVNLFGEPATFVDRVNLLAAATQFIALIVGIFTLVGAYSAIKASKAMQREASAGNVYAEQLRLDLQHPEFIYPDLSQIIRDGKFPQFVSYVSHLFCACDEVRTHSSKIEWREAVKYPLAHQHAYISMTPEVVKSGYYSAELRSLMKEALSSYDQILEPVIFEASKTPSQATEAKVSI